MGRDLLVVRSYAAVRIPLKMGVKVNSSLRLAAFHTDDEGEHWHRSIRRTLSEDKTIIRDWYEARLKRLDSRNQ